MIGASVNLDATYCQIAGSPPAARRLSLVVSEQPTQNNRVNTAVKAFTNFDMLNLPLQVEKLNIGSLRTLLLCTHTTASKLTYLNKLVKLRGQDSNLEPTPYTSIPHYWERGLYHRPLVVKTDGTRGASCRRLPELLPCGIVSTPSPTYCWGLARDCPKCRSPPNSPRLQPGFLREAAF